MKNKQAPDKPGSHEPDTLRLDLWLWSARFFRTRSMAAEAIGKNRVTVNDLLAKPARLVRVGDRITLRRPGNPLPQAITVLGLARMRGPASIASMLCLETPESQQARANQAERQRLAPEPAAQRPGGRPTKRDRRAISEGAERWDRWSAEMQGPKS
jgi:ribosome-associated heat shock protein Hsp15